MRFVNLSTKGTNLAKIRRFCRLEEAEEFSPNEEISIILSGSLTKIIFLLLITLRIFSAAQLLGKS